MNVQLLDMQTFAKQLNNMTFTDYYYRLMLLARSVFKWDGLPPSINEKWVERILFLKGECVVYKDKNLGLIVTEFNNTNNVNMYNEYTEVAPFGVGFTPSPANIIVSGDKANGVLIRNNDECLSTSFFVKLFAYRLAEISRTIDINIHAQKTPTLILGSEKQKHTLKNLYKQWNGFEPVIYGDKSLDIDSIKVLKTDSPIVFPELQVQKQSVWNECLTFLGINNANTEKRERLITDEVEANNTHIDLSAGCLLKARERACEELNRMFNTNISVRLRTDAELKEVMDSEPDETEVKDES